MPGGKMTRRYITLALLNTNDFMLVPRRKKMKKLLSSVVAVMLLASCRVWGAPTFSDPTSPNPTVTFDAPGTYVLQAVVSDGALSTTRTTTITVNPPITLGSLTAGAASGIAGTNVTVPVTHSAGSAGIAGVQFDIPLPTGVAYVSVDAGQAALDAGKSVQGNVTSGNLRVIVFGVNQTIIGSGELARVNFHLDAALPTSVVPVQLTAVVATDAGGNNVSFDTSTDGSINVTANQAPVVTISPDQTITLPDTADVSVTATDDGAPDPGILTYQWSVQ